MIATRATRSRGKQLVVEAIKISRATESGHSNLPDIEDVVPQSDSSLSSLESETPVSQSKKRKATTSRKAVTRVSRRKTGEQLSQSPPVGWEEVYAEIKAMRANINAPVDTMGCEQLGKTEADPKVIKTVHATEFIFLIKVPRTGVSRRWLD
jgi:endonuclease-3